ncbi:MAG: peptide chain release factor N(5)-glutamine methyltransferase [Gemmatimonadales bacterium]
MPPETVACAASLGELARRATLRLHRAGFERPRREALWLIAGRLGLDPGAIVLHAERPIPADLEAWVDRAVERRVSGEPLAYIAGSAGFRTLDLVVDRRVLIPRPETEGLVEVALTLTRCGVAADIGVGSGAIALSLAAEGGFGRVIGVELSRDALAVARANRDRVAPGVALVHGDLVAPLAPASVDLLVSNPPYVAIGERDELDRGVRDYEPALALYGGQEGHELTTRLLADARRVVRPGGWLAVEIASARAEAAAHAAGEHGWDQVGVANDSFGRPRYLTARRPR